MSTGSGDAGLPPLLEDDGAVRFASSAALRAWLGSDLDFRPLTVLNRADVPPFGVTITLRLGYAGCDEDVAASAVAHRARGDLIELSIRLQPGELGALRALTEAVPPRRADAEPPSAPRPANTPRPITGALPGASSHRSGPMPAATRATGPMPAATRATGPMPTATRATGPMPTATRATGPMPAAPRTSGPLPSTARSSGPTPTATRSTGPMPSTAHSSGPLPSTARSSGPLPNIARPSGPQPSTVRSSGPLPNVARPSGPLPSTARSSGPLPSIERPSGPSQTPTSAAPARPARTLPTTEVRVVHGLDALRPGTLPATLFGVFVGLARRPRPGRLTIEADGQSWTADFDSRGGIVGFDGDLVKALVNQQLLSANSVSLPPGSGIAAQVKAISAASPAPTGQALRDEVRRMLVRTLLRLGMTRPLAYRFAAGVSGTDPAFKPMHLFEFAAPWVSDVLAKVGGEAIGRSFEQRMESFVVLESDASWNPTLLPLDEPTLRLVRELVGREAPTIGEVLSISRLGRPRTFHLLVLLEALEMFRSATSRPAVAASAGAGARAGAGAGAASSDHGALKQRVQESRANHFAALGIHFSAHWNEYPQAVNRVRQKYGPSSDQAKASSEAARLCEEIVRRAAEAAAFLSLPEQRAAYRTKVTSADERKSAVAFLVNGAKLAEMRGEKVAETEMLEVVRELAPSARKA